MKQSDVNIFFQTMLSYKPNISDLHFYVGRPPQVEIDGLLVSVPIPQLERLSPFHVERIAFCMMGQEEDALRKFLASGCAEFSYSVPGSSRFRVSVYQQRGTFAIVMRVIGYGVPNIKDLGLPDVLLQVSDEKNGIVLVTGPTGSGKSTTIAALINEINQKHAYHIITIEDPVEYMHRHQVASICQRELGSDTVSFAGALRAALRQSPKVIVVGEIRDLETMEISLEAAETGHLVLSSLHTVDAAKTIDRIIGIFPPSDEQQIRVRFAQAFKWVISQKLVPQKTGGRIPVVEILKSTARTREYIMKGAGEGRSILDAMTDASLDGMQTFDKDLERMVRKNIIKKDVALSYATNPNNLALALQGSSEEGDAAAAFVELLQKEVLEAEDILKAPEAMQAVLDTTSPDEIDQLFKKIFGYLNHGDADEKVAVIQSVPALCQVLSQHERWKNVELSVALIAGRSFQKETDPEVQPAFLAMFIHWFSRRYRARNFSGAQEITTAVQPQVEKNERLKRMMAQGAQSLLDDLLTEIRAGSSGADCAVEFLRLSGAKGAEYLIDYLIEEKDRSVRMRLLNYIPKLEPEAVAPQIERRITDYRWYVVRNMVTIMTKLNVPGGPAFLKQASEHSEPRVVKEVARKLIQSSNSADSPLVLQLLKHQEKSIRMQAVHLCGVLNLTSTISTILKYGTASGPEDADLRTSCLQALLKLGAREAVGLAKAVLEKKYGSKTDSAERNAAIRVIGEFSRDSGRSILEKIASADSNAETRTLAGSYLQ